MIQQRCDVAYNYNYRSNGSDVRWGGRVSDSGNGVMMLAIIMVVVWHVCFMCVGGDITTV